MRKSVRLIGILAIMAMMVSVISFTAFSGTSSPIATADASKESTTGVSKVAATIATADSLTDEESSESDTAKATGKGSIILYVGSPVAFVDGIQTQIDLANIEVTPVIIDNTEMVPVRFIAENLGGTVKWNQRTLTATIVLDGKSYNFTQGSDTMTAGQSRHDLGAVVQAYKGRTFVPLDTFVEILDKKAFYDRGLIIISDEKDIFDPVKDKDMISDWIQKLSYLPVAGSYDKLVSLIEESWKSELDYGTRIGKELNGMDMPDMATTQGVTANESAPSNAKTAAASDSSAATAPEPAPGADSAQQEFSTTNVQVQGVDEGDIVKTDGNYIYHVNRERVVITKVDAPENMKVVSTLEYIDKNLNPQELYLYDQRLIVIGTSRAYFPVRIMENEIQKEIYPAPRSSQRSVKVLVYDMTDRANLKLLREVELEGDYVSSRKVGSALYLIANDRLNYNRIQNNEKNITPSYRDTALKEDYINIGYDSIHYFPSTIHNNYMIVAGIDVEGNDAANVSTYLGAGENIYASTGNLYVAVSNYSRTYGRSASEDSTQLYKFAMKDAQVTYLCKGEVPGTILNQFSMDEKDNTFRIATTKGNVWATGERISKNALYILDSMLSITGRVEDMAPGEKIYSVRFMGDRAYVVTFKTVDPLFVIDLKDPEKPAILGALKIPGYSDYLHPYDENHIMGFGKDTVEIKGQAYYLGMKVALFDVTDVTNPIQKFSEMIGDRGTDSELLSNHKALLFSREKNMLAFPVTLMEIKDSYENVKMSNSLQYGEFAFQGALVYQLDLEKGFQLKGKITHLTEEDYIKAGNSWYNSDKNVQRIIYIGDNLFTLSNQMIKANDMEDLKEKGSILIP